MSELKKRLIDLTYGGLPRVHALIEKPGPGIHSIVTSVDVLANQGFRGDHPKKDWWRGKRISDREVTAMAAEVLAALQIEVAVPGDNLITEGVDLSALKPGDRLIIGSVVLKRSQKDHRPCDTFGHRATTQAKELIGELGLRGALFAVDEGGRIECGDLVTVVSVNLPEHRAPSGA